MGCPGETPSVLMCAFRAKRERHCIFLGKKAIIVTSKHGTIIFSSHCVLPENIHTHPKDGHWKFQRGRGLKGQNFLKERMKLGWGNSNQNTILGGSVDIFWNNLLQSFSRKT